MIHTIELLQHPPIPDAWHNITAPGGYEWWYFDAEDIENDRQLVAMLFDGFVFHPRYLRRYLRYERHPTRFAPPRPREFTAAYFAVYHAGKIEHQFLSQHPAEEFEARGEKRHVVIGANRFTAGNALKKFELTLGGATWQMAVRNPQLLKHTGLFAYLTCSPRFDHAPGEREFFTRQLAGADHRWIIANPLCDVEGKIVIPGAKVISFRGRGYHDHNFGMAPIGPGIARWFCGRMLLDNRCVTFHFAQPCDWKLEPEVHLIEIDSAGSREVDIDVERIEIDWSSKAKWWLRYPATASFQSDLRLENPRVIDSSPFFARMIYDATWRGSRGTALCSVAHPQRLRWPVLGRLIERSIDTHASR